MVPLIGNFTLWLSLIFSIYQIVIFYKKKNFLSINLDAIPVYGLLISSLLSFFFLIYSHIISDFSLLNVFQNSHTTKPLFYKISGVWGNHEGSMLLWILVISIFNYFIFKSYNKKNYSFISIALETQGLIRRPKFVKSYVKLNDVIEKAVKKYCLEVVNKKFPKKNNTYL